MITTIIEESLVDRRVVRWHLSAAVAWMLPVTAGFLYQALDPDGLGRVDALSRGTFLNALRYNPLLRLPEFAETFPDAINTVTAAHRYEDPIRHMTFELLEKLEGDRLEALDPERICHTAARAYDAGGEPVTPANQPPQEFILPAASKNGSSVAPHEGQLQVRRFFVTEHH